MVYGFRCVDCDYEWDNDNIDYPNCCPNCGDEEIEETYEIQCKDCDYVFIGAENDECPECQSTETYEV